MTIFTLPLEKTLDILPQGKILLSVWTWNTSKEGQHHYKNLALLGLSRSCSFASKFTGEKLTLFLLILLLLILLLLHLRSHKKTLSARYCSHTYTYSAVAGPHKSLYGQFNLIPWDIFHCYIFQISGILQVQLQQLLMINNMKTFGKWSSSNSV